MADTIINGKAYSANDVEIFMMGRLVTGMTEINYDSQEDVSDVYAIGSKKPIDFISGNQKHESDFTLLQDEIIGLELALGSSILDARPFDITIVFKKMPIVVQQVIKGFKPKGRQAGVQAGSSDAIGTKITGRVQDIPGIKPL
jgi:hypothetical protein